MDSQKIFICECGSYCHQTMFWYNKEDKQLHFTTHLITYRNFFKRLWIAIRYVFGYKSNYGDWDTFLFKPLDEAKLLAYLNKTNLTFTQQLEMDFIPAIEQMAEKERLHLQWLKSQNAKKEFIENSAFFLNHYRNRLKEYQDYASKL